jgi:hypothetical protein
MNGRSNLHVTVVSARKNAYQLCGSPNVSLLDILSEKLDKDSLKRTPRTKKDEMISKLASEMSEAQFTSKYLLLDSD